MGTLTLQEFLSRLNEYLLGELDFSDIRRIVFEYYGGESDLRLCHKLEEVFGILLPYLHFEESFGDECRDIRLDRLHGVLSTPGKEWVERTIYALEFDRIEELAAKLEGGMLDQDAYYDQMGKLSPVRYDTDRLIYWAQAHRTP